jgi:hypothetical protein
MALLRIETNVLQTEDVLVEDFTYTIPKDGGFEEFDETQEIKWAQDSRDLLEYLTDDKFAPGSSTLVLRDSTGTLVPQTQVLDYLATLLEPQYAIDEFPIAAVPPVDFILTEVPLLRSQRVYLNGQRQREGAVDDYTISGDTVTMVRVIRPGDLVSVEYQHV